MKNKLLIIISCFAIAVCTAFAFVGCKKNNVKSSNSTESVVSNGGMVVEKDNTVYFIGGVSEEATLNSVIYCATKADDGSLSNIKPFVKNFAGFKYGSLHIFGDYLYFITPSTAKDAEGEVQSGILRFCRVKLSGGKTHILYSTKSNDETNIQYGYYPVEDEDLYLVVYEASAKTITSVCVGTNPTKKVIAKNVTGVLFAENGNVAGAAEYVYYTTQKPKTQANQTGNVVKRILPTGKEEATISTESKTFSLITLVNGKLIYSDGSYIYVTADTIDTTENTIISYVAASSYDQIKYYENKLLIKDSDNNIMFIEWQNGTLNTTKVCENVDAEFLATFDNKLVYSVSSIIYVVELTENAEPLKICETKIDDATGLVMAEVVGEYLYFMHTEEDVSTAYRVKVAVTELQTAEKLVG